MLGRARRISRFLLFAGAILLANTGGAAITPSSTPQSSAPGHVSSELTVTPGNSSRSHPRLPGWAATEPVPAPGQRLTKEQTGDPQNPTATPRQSRQSPSSALGLDQRVASSHLVAGSAAREKLSRRALVQRKYLNRHFTKRQRTRIRTGITARKYPRFDKTLLTKKNRHLPLTPKKRVLGSEFAFRGVVEGFYGRPWSHQERLSMLAFMGQMNMNMYLFAPKNEKKHREDWSVPYSSNELQRFQQLVEAAKAAGVQFNYGISPGLGLTYSSTDDFNTLTAKLQSLYNRGVRHFTVMMDDTVSLSYNLATQDGLNAADRNELVFTGSPPSLRYPTLGHAHLEFVNKVSAWLKSLDPSVELYFVPATYSASMLSPNSPVETAGAATYLETVKKIDEGVHFFWTGPKIVSEKLLSTEASKWRSWLGRKPILWHNYPVNDWVGNGRLHLNPFQSLSTDLSSYVSGILSNGMIEAEASKVPLYTFARYLENPAIYNPAIAGTVARVSVLGSMPNVVALWEANPDVRAEADHFIGDARFLNWLVNEAWMLDKKAAIFAPADLFGRPGLENAGVIWKESATIRAMFNDEMGDGKYLEWLRTTGWKIDSRALPFAPASVWNSSNP